MKMADMEQVMERLRSIQEQEVQIALSRYRPGDNVEDLLYDVTYSVLVETMTMLDGYGPFGGPPMTFVDRRGVDGAEDLHDRVCAYLRYEKPDGD